MILQWMMDIDTALEFYKRAKEQKAETEEERLGILKELATEGRIQSVIGTNRTKAQIVADLNKHYNVIEVKKDEA